MGYKVVLPARSRPRRFEKGRHVKTTLRDVCHFTFPGLLLTHYLKRLALPLSANRFLRTLSLISTLIVPLNGSLTAHSLPLTCSATKCLASRADPRRRRRDSFAAYRPLAVSVAADMQGIALEG